jgi:YD repeat-containing protein
MKGTTIFFVIISAFLFAAMLSTPAHAAAVTVTYAYDTLGRVTKATYSNGTMIAYTYDASGNRTAQTVTCSAAGC